MTEASQRVFRLYYSGHTVSEISRLCSMKVNQIRYIMDDQGEIYVREFLDTKQKDNLYALECKGYNSQRIAELLGAPWNKWMVLFTLKRMNGTTPEAEAEDEKTFRCGRCSGQFQMKNVEIADNPSRLCEVCK